MSGYVAEVSSSEAGVTGGEFPGRMTFEVYFVQITPMPRAVGSDTSEAFPQRSHTPAKWMGGPSWRRCRALLRQRSDWPSASTRPWRLDGVWIGPLGARWIRRTGLRNTPSKTSSKSAALPRGSWAEDRLSQAGGLAQLFLSASGRTLASSCPEPPQGKNGSSPSDQGGEVFRESV